MLKTLVNTIMDCVGAPPHAWFLYLQYVTFLLNSMYSPQLKCTPLFALTGSTNDISMLLYFYFWQPVYFRHGESTIFPSGSKESRGCFVGIAENVGHAMTFKVLANNSQKVLFRSAICSAIAPGEQNLRVIHLVGSHLPSCSYVTILSPKCLLIWVARILTHPLLMQMRPSHPNSLCPTPPTLLAAPSCLTPRGWPTVLRLHC